MARNVISTILCTAVAGSLLTIVSTCHRAEPEADRVGPEALRTSLASNFSSLVFSLPREGTADVVRQVLRDEGSEDVHSEVNSGENLVASGWVRLGDAETRWDARIISTQEGSRVFLAQQWRRWGTQEPLRSGPAQGEVEVRILRVLDPKVLARLEGAARRWSKGSGRDSVDPLSWWRRNWFAAVGAGVGVFALVWLGFRRFGAEDGSRRRRSKADGGLCIGGIGVFLFGVINLVLGALPPQQWFHLEGGQAWAITASGAGSVAGAFLMRSKSRLLGLRMMQLSAGILLVGALWNSADYPRKIPANGLEPWLEFAAVVLWVAVPVLVGGVVERLVRSHRSKVASPDPTA